MNLEWDEGKNEINKQKHHISFETASYVFADPFRLERLDRSENNNREEDSYRLISARLADARERRIYYGDSQETDSGWRKAD